jgi:hypothetical protein
MDESAKKAVKRFCDQVFWLRVVRHIYEELFEKEDSSTLMGNTASSFFADLNTILQNYLLLEFVKVTDPPKTGKKENLTVDNVVMSIDWPPGIREKLRSLSEKTKGFRNHVLGARNKLLAHIDKEAFLAEKTLGGFPEGEDEIFLKALEEICDIAHEACFGRIFGQMLLAEPGDVINFKRTLANGIALDQLLAESKGQEKMKLYSYLEKARRPGERKKKGA